MKYVRLGGRGGGEGIPRAVFREMEALKQVCCHVIYLQMHLTYV